MILDRERAIAEAKITADALVVMTECLIERLEQMGLESGRDFSTLDIFRMAVTLDAHRMAGNLKREDGA
jgi:hypothetical protein